MSSVAIGLDRYPLIVLRCDGLMIMANVWIDQHHRICLGWEIFLRVCGNFVNKYEKWQNS